MEWFTAVVLGIVAGVLVKTLFLKDSPMIWDAAFGAIGGLVAYYLTRVLEGNVAEYLAVIGTAAIVAGVLHRIRGGFGKTA